MGWREGGGDFGGGLLREEGGRRDGLGFAEGGEGKWGGFDLVGENERVVFYGGMSMGGLSWLRWYL